MSHLCYQQGGVMTQVIKSNYLSIHYLGADCTTQEQGLGLELAVHLHIFVDVEAAVEVGYVLPKALRAEEHVPADPTLVLCPQVPRQGDLLGLWAFLQQIGHFANDLKRIQAFLFHYYGLRVRVEVAVEAAGVVIIKLLLLAVQDRGQDR